MRNETAMQSNSAHFVKNANLSHFEGGMNLLKTGQAGATHCSYPQGLNKKAQTCEAGKNVMQSSINYINT